MKSPAACLFLITGLALTLSACVTPAKVYEVQRTKKFAASKDQTWERLMRFFATNNIQVKTLEKASGVIYAEHIRVQATDDFGGYASCARELLATPASQSLSLNVFVTGGGPSESEATVTAKYVESYFQSTYIRIADQTCNSTGLLEQKIMDALSTP